VNESANRDESRGIPRSRPGGVLNELLCSAESLSLREPAEPKFASRAVSDFPSDEGSGSIEGSTSLGEKSLCVK
jgi:hypothetical protein